MKARTQAQKRRGRKRKDTLRYPSGQPHKETADQVMSVATEARMRVHGFSKETSKQQFAGTFVGRLHLAGDLTRAQLDACDYYQQTTLAYRTALKAPGKLTTGRSANLDESEYEKQCRQAIERFDAMALILREVDRIHGINSLGILEPAVIRDQNMPWAIGDLRTALNAIHKRFLDISRAA